MTTLIDLCSLLRSLNGLIDGGLHEGVTVAEAEQHIEAGDVLQWLDTRFKDDIDLSLFVNSPDRAVAQEVTNVLQDLLRTYRGSARDWGVRNNGICLLIAWTVEMIQRNDWVEKDEPLPEVRHRH
jgi:hypothetical protein